MKRLNKEITFMTAPFNHQVACYWKNTGYDVYLNGSCIITNATFENIEFLKQLTTKQNE